MSAITMFITCVYCKKRYPYNPSVGDFGRICKHCGMMQPLDEQKSSLLFKKKI